LLTGTRLSNRQAKQSRHPRGPVAPHHAAALIHVSLLGNSPREKMLQVPALQYPSMNGYTIDLVHSHTLPVSAISTQETDDHPLDFDPSGIDNDWLKFRVRRLKPNMITLRIEPLEGHAFAIYERHNHLSLSRFLP